MHYNLQGFCIHVRSIKAMTQQQFAEFMDVSPGTVSRWENGKAIPDLKHLGVMRTIARKQHRQSNKLIISVCPVIKVMLLHDDPCTIVAVSRGFLDASGLKADDVETIKHSATWVRAVDEIAMHPGYAARDIAWATLRHKSNTMGWLEGIIYHTNDGGCLMYEGRQVERGPYSVEIVPYAATERLPDDDYTDAVASYHAGYP